MSKFLFIMIFMIIGSSNLYAAENGSKPIFVGTYKGSTQLYYPKAVINYVQIYTNSGTTGIGKSMPDLVEDTASSLFDSAKEAAQKRCSDSKYFAIDNYNIGFSPFGQYSNVLVQLSCNMVCITKL